MGKLRPLGRRRAALIFCCALLGMATLPATAAAAGATTGQATGVTSTSATLNGTVTVTRPGGATWHFEYGTTTAYGHSAPTPSASRASGGPVSQTVTGLTPGTTYHFRLVAQDNYKPAGSSPPGKDATFTTPLTPTTIATTGQATSVTATSATLNGVVNAGKAGATWLFEYGRTTSYDHFTKTTATDSGLTLVAATITGLKPHTTYHFRLVVHESPPDPPTSAGSDSSFTTARPVGKLKLRRHGLIVRHGTAAIPLKCTGPRGAVCKGTLTLKTSTKSGKRVRTVACGRGKLSKRAPSMFTDRVKLSARCVALLSKAPHHQLAAQLKFVPPHPAKGLSTRVRLIRR